MGVPGAIAQTAVVATTALPATKMAENSVPKTATEQPANVAKKRRRVQQKKTKLNADLNGQGMAANNNELDQNKILRNRGEGEELEKNMLDQDM